VRDPEGSLELRGEQLVRTFAPNAAALPFLRGPTARRLVDDGRLVPFEFTSPVEMAVERLRFVSAPFEWCDAQLRDAAQLTLDVSRAALAEGCELKDATAWNVIFAGSRPVFCDHLSFRPLPSRQWWAFGQFLRHFVFPLQAARLAGLHGADAFRLGRDGLDADRARRLLGWRRFRTGAWPLMRASARGTDEATAMAAGTLPVRQPYHGNLYGYLEWALPGKRSAAASGSHWSSYTETRTHYEQQALAGKRAVVDEWLARSRPTRVVDVGANTGEFSHAAARAGADVVALEQDHECVERLYLSAAGDRRIHPVLVNVADACGGSGWLGAEHSGLRARLAGNADLVLMLAVIHHLAVSESIPFTLIAQFVDEVTTAHAIVEFIDAADPMLVRLARQRGREPGEFSIERQREAFAARFEFVAEHRLDATRTLVLMQRKVRG
jgi:hypothetical protein